MLRIHQYGCVSDIAVLWTELDRLHSALNIYTFSEKSLATCYLSMTTPAAQDASAGPGKPLSTEMMQNTNLFAVRTRVIELQGTIERLKMAYQTHHDLTW